MNLIIQLKSLMFSFAFGIIFSTILNIFEKFIYHNKLFVKLIASFLVSLTLSLIYFIFNIIINDGRIHIYFIGIMIFGYFIEYKYINLHERLKKMCKGIKRERK